jgi:PAS domain S-box-containing protein
LQDQNYNFDVILLDLSLPDISRERLIDEAVKILQATPIIILTGYSDMDFAANSLSIGISDYLVKDTISPLVLYKSLLYAFQRFRFLQSLRASEKRYFDLFHLSPAPMFVFDIQTLSFLDVNEAAIQHYGYSKKEFLSMSLIELRPEEDIPLLYKTIAESHGKILFHVNETVRHKKKDGSIIFVEIKSSTIQFEDKDAKIVLATDLTDRITHQKAIENQNIRLKEIAWTQSHVVRAPVAKILGLIDLLKTNELPPEEQNALLGHIFSSAEEIDQIIKDIVYKAESVLNA